MEGEADGRQVVSARQPQVRCPAGGCSTVARLGDFEPLLSRAALLTLLATAFRFARPGGEQLLCTNGDCCEPPRPSAGCLFVLTGGSVGHAKIKAASSGCFFNGDDRSGEKCFSNDQ